MAPSFKHTGWRMNRNSSTVSSLPVPALELRAAGDAGATVAPFVFGVGTHIGRIATTNIAGSAITVPDSYPFG